MESRNSPELVRSDEKTNEAQPSCQGVKCSSLGEGRTDLVDLLCQEQLTNRSTSCFSHWEGQATAETRVYNEL